MGGLDELIDRHEVAHGIAAGRENGRVTGESPGVTGHHDHGLHPGCDQFTHLRLGPRTGRIEHHGLIGQFELRQRVAEQVAGPGRHLAQALGETPRLVERGNAGLVAVGGKDRALFGQAQGKGADTQE